MASLPFVDRLARASQARPPRHRLRGPCHRRGQSPTIHARRALRSLVARSLLTAASCRKFGGHRARPLARGPLEKSNSSDWAWLVCLLRSKHIRPSVAVGPTCCDWAVMFTFLRFIPRPSLSFKGECKRLRSLFFYHSYEEADAVYELITGRRPPFPTEFFQHKLRRSYLQIECCLEPPREFNEPAGIVSPNRFISKLRFYVFIERFRGQVQSPTLRYSRQ